MPTDAEDVARMEFEALRSEIVSRTQAQGAIVTAALTILAAVGSFALAKKDGRTQMLLVLPLVLSGLGLLLIQGTQGNQRISRYIRDCLWERLPSSDQSRFPSWEHYVAAYRTVEHSRFSLGAVLGVLPAALIFGIPSVASLVITGHEASTKFAPLWWAGVGAVGLFALLSLSLRHEAKGPAP